ncbi:MAG: type II secretion system ATPase GspE [Thermodesulfobacteriota bacterium]
MAESGMRDSSSTGATKILKNDSDSPLPSLQRLKAAPLLDKLTRGYMEEYKVFPLELKGDTLLVAMADPSALNILNELTLALGYQIESEAWPEEMIVEAIDRFYGEGAATIGKIVAGMDQEEIYTPGEEAEPSEDSLRGMAQEAPVVRMVNLLITKAVELGASDIHIEPFEEKLRVRYRIDGVLYDAESPPKGLQPAIISRIKIMAKLNVAERRLPQDGRIRTRIPGRDFDIRVSTIPTLYGESVVLRLLDKEMMLLGLDQLGFSPLVLHGFKNVVSRPYGMILVTGPTGSGKTTTLYAALNTLNSTEKKIITIEDPVEYQLEGVNQIPVKPQIGLTFASGLRSIVRQDPDVILVGEVRDRETAEIAIRAALTGHLVFCTLHTNDAAGAITRLLDMGIEDYLLASSILAILAQRLLRLVCLNCREPLVDQPERKKGLAEDDIDEELVSYRGRGCESCHNTGYKGRIGLFEFLTVDDEIRHMILTKTSSSTIKASAQKKGMVSLRDDGLIKVKQGITSLAEMVRVTQDEESP